MVKGVIEHQGREIDTLVFGNASELPCYRILNPGDLLTVCSIRRSNHADWKDDLLANALPWEEQHIETVIRVHAVMDPTSRRLEPEFDEALADEALPRRTQLELPVDDAPLPDCAQCIEDAAVAPCASDFDPSDAGPIRMVPRLPRRKLTLALRDDHFALLDGMARSGETRQEVIRRFLDEKAESLSFAYGQTRT